MVRPLFIIYKSLIVNSKHPAILDNKANIEIKKKLKIKYPKQTNKNKK